ncbi:YncE family protein [Halosimplex aquaticum]
MGTVAPSGDRLLVEHQTGTESVWDTSDPANPDLLAQLTPDDGLGEGALTSEIGPDSRVGYVFTPGTNDVSVVDIEHREVADRIDLGGAAFVGTWGPGHEKLYVPVQTNDEVAVLDHESREIVARIPVGSAPYGATAARVRPETDESASLLAAMAAVGWTSARPTRRTASATAPAVTGCSGTSLLSGRQWTVTSPSSTVMSSRLVAS